MSDNEIISIPLEITTNSIIKIVGVGGGGGNAVNELYQHDSLHDVSFMVCNTDLQAMEKLSVPNKLQIGFEGLGAGGDPEKARNLAEESREDIKKALSDGTKMVFIIAGMGGGTGTGASPIIAEIAQELNILTVAIVTLPFAFEGEIKIRKAMTGAAKLAEHVDALLMMNNEKYIMVDEDMDMAVAFQCSNELIGKAAKSISDIITRVGVINTDFNDVKKTLAKSGIAIIGEGVAGGDNRFTDAVDQAIHSPLMSSVNTQFATRLLFHIYCSHDRTLKIKETRQINDFVSQMSKRVEVQWGWGYDDDLGDDMRVTIVTAGYGRSGIPVLDETDTDGISIDEAIDRAYEGTSFVREEADRPRTDEGGNTLTIDFGSDTLFGSAQQSAAKDSKPTAEDSKPAAQVAQPAAETAPEKTTSTPTESRTTPEGTSTNSRTTPEGTSTNSRTTPEASPSGGITIEVGISNPSAPSPDGAPHTSSPFHRGWRR